jgi:hypothetical protein
MRTRSRSFGARAVYDAGISATCRAASTPPLWASGADPTPAASHCLEGPISLGGSHVAGPKLPLLGAGAGVSLPLRLSSRVPTGAHVRFDSWSGA